MGETADADCARLREARRDRRGLACGDASAVDRHARHRVDPGYELRRRGHAAYDADDDGFSEPRGDGRWGWRAHAVAALLERPTDGPLFFAGCSEEQADLPFDYRVLLTAPGGADRATARPHQQPLRADRRELAQILTDLAEIEPLLRRTADLVLDDHRPDGAARRSVLLRHIAERRSVP